MEKCYVCGASLEVIKDRPYEYSESGLSVNLLGITQYRCNECGEEFAAIPKPEQLHRIIGADICRNRKALLLPEEIKFLRKELHLKAQELARIIGVTPSTVSRWENGKSPIGEVQDRFLRSIYLSCCGIDHDQCEKDSCSLLEVFRELPAKRKKIKEPHSISLNPQEWMMNGQVCPA